MVVQSQALSIYILCINTHAVIIKNDQPVHVSSVVASSPPVSLSARIELSSKESSINEDSNNGLDFINMREGYRSFINKKYS